MGTVQLTGPKDHYADVIGKAYNAANPDAKMIITETKMMGKNGNIVIRTRPGRKAGNTKTWVQLTGPKSFDAVLKAYNAANPDAKMIAKETNMKAKNGTIKIRTKSGRKGNRETWIELTGPEKKLVQTILQVFKDGDPMWFKIIKQDKKMTKATGRFGAMV